MLLLKTSSDVSLGHQSKFVQGATMQHLARSTTLGAVKKQDPLQREHPGAVVRNPKTSDLTLSMVVLSLEMLLCAGPSI